MHRVYCPSCHVLQDASPEAQLEPLPCESCGFQFFNLGALPIPDWRTQLGGFQLEAPPANWFAFEKMCPFCGKAVENDEICPRCRCDLTKCAVIDRAACFDTLGKEEVQAYKKLAVADISSLHAMLRLYRAPSRLVRRMGGDVAFADAMHPLPFDLETIRVEASREEGDHSLHLQEMGKGKLFRLFQVVKSLGLVIGFYLLLLVFSLGLLLIPILTPIFHLYLLVICWPTAFLTLWAARPRLDRFQQPGIALKEEQAPKLYQMIREIAHLSEQEMPKQIYLFNDYNAFVTHRGGVLGIGSKKILGIGWPLLFDITERQLQAILAHEFGHYRGGDIAFGAFIYRFREAMARTYQQVAGMEIPILKTMIEKMGDAFFNTTAVISRYQEFQADAWAGELVGKQAIIDGFQCLSYYGKRYQIYLSNCFFENLSLGIRPRLLEGFRMFLEGNQDKTEHETLYGNVDHFDAHPLDTHPAQSVRIQALQTFPDVGPYAAGESPASGLVEDMNALEEQLFLEGYVTGMAEDSDPLPWDEIGRKIIPRRLAELAEYKIWEDVLEMTPADYPEKIIHSWASLMDDSATRDERRDFALDVFSHAVTFLALEESCEISYRPGQEVTVFKGDMEFKPKEVLEKACAAEDPEAYWREAASPFIDFTVTWAQLQKRLPGKEDNRSYLVQNSPIPAKVIRNHGGTNLRTAILLSFLASLVTLAFVFLQPGILSLLSFFVLSAPMWGTFLFTRYRGRAHIGRLWIKDGKFHYAGKRKEIVIPLEDLQHIKVCRYSEIVGQSIAMGAFVQIKHGGGRFAISHFVAGDDPQAARFEILLNLLVSHLGKRRAREIRENGPVKIGALQLGTDSFRIGKKQYKYSDISLVDHRDNNLGIFKMEAPCTLAYVSSSVEDGSLIPVIVDTLRHEPVPQKAEDPLYYRRAVRPVKLQTIIWAANGVLAFLWLVFFFNPMSLEAYVWLTVFTLLGLGALLRLRRCRVEIYEKHFVLLTFLNVYEYDYDQITFVNPLFYDEMGGMKAVFSIHAEDGAEMEPSFLIFGFPPWVSFWMYKLEEGVATREAQKLQGAYRWWRGIFIYFNRIEDRKTGVSIAFDEQLRIREEDEKLQIFSADHPEKAVVVPRRLAQFQLGYKVLCDALEKQHVSLPPSETGSPEPT